MAGWGERFAAIAITAVLLAAIGCGRGTPEPEPVPSPPLGAEAAPTATNTPQAATPTPSPTATPTPTSTPAPTATPSPVPTQSPTPSPTPTTTTLSAPYFEQTPCSDFGVSIGQGFSCGFLTVSENRSQPDGPTIKLAVVIAESASDNPAPDPVVYLAGGPGENAIEASRFQYGRHFVKFTADRDLIIFDQRGTGLSEPALDCPELIELRDETIGQDLSIEEGVKLGLDAFGECHDRLEREGVNFAAYTSAESAADVKDLMDALGYEEWNLYGISYGSRLALTTMRDHPEDIRSVVLDSTYPLQSNLYTAIPANADRAFNVLFDGCASDPECSAAYPGLEDVYLEAVEKLNANPVSITITNPLTGESLDPLIDGTSLTGFVFQSLYMTEVIPSLPKIIYNARDGSLDTMALIMGSRLVMAELISQGMQLSVQCGEEVAFTTREAIAAAAEPYPGLQDFINGSPSLGNEIVTLCQGWGAREAEPVEDEPVRSDIPTLVLAGAYDPITPPAWGRLVASDLSNAYFFEFSGVGHGASVNNECPLSITLAFLDNPQAEPDAGCIPGMGEPAFAVPVTEITLVPLDNDLFGISGVVPEGWTEIAPGIYGRTALGEVAIVQQAAPLLGTEGFLNLLADQLGLDAPLASTGTYEGENLTWSLYETKAQGLSLDIALAEEGGITYVVVLQSPESERDFYYNEVFLPALDAFTPGPN